MKLNYKLQSNTIKSVIAVMICLIISYFSGNRDVIFFSGVATIVCMQSTHIETAKSGFYRFLGTIIGGSIGIITSVLIGFLPDSLPGAESLLVCFAVLLAIYICNLLKISVSVSINCIVFLNVVTNYNGLTDGAFLYVSSRTIYTLIGAAVAYLINRIIFSYRGKQFSSDIGRKTVSKISNYKIQLEYKLGLRALKTVLSIFICITFSYVIGIRDAIFFCGVAAVVCIQKTQSETIQTGIYTVGGTVLGGIFGLLIVEFCSSLSSNSAIIEIICIVAAVFVIIYFCNLFYVNGAIPISCIILLKTTSYYGALDNVNGMFWYFLSHILLFTLFGVVVAYIVNKYISPVEMEDFPENVEF